MQFFDRPGRSKIALRGSSTRPPTSQQLIARARKAREERALKRAQHNAATTLQAACRAKDANTTAAKTLCLSSTLPAHPVVKLLLAARILNVERHSVSAALRLVRETIKPQSVREVVEKLLDTRWHIEEMQEIDHFLLVRAIVVLLALAEHTLRQNDPATYPFIQKCLSTASDITQCLTSHSLYHQAAWGLHIHAAKVFRLVHTTERKHLLESLLKTTDKAMALTTTNPSDPVSHMLITHFALSFLSVPDAVQNLPLTSNVSIVCHLLHAIATPHTIQTDAFEWDVAHSLSALDTPNTTIMLLNFLEMGHLFWSSKDRDSLFSFIGVLSSLIQTVPSSLTFSESVDDDGDEEMTDESPSWEPKGAVLRAAMARLSTSLKRVVSEGNVRNLFTAAIADGQQAVIRVCQLFNFLMRREKDLHDDFQGALAFWRGSRSGGKSHILKDLWRYCHKRPDKLASPVEGVDPLSSLSEEASPVLAIFSSAYAYLLYVQDADELFEANWPFNVREVRDIAYVLKQYMFSALYTKHAGMSSVSKQRQFVELLRREPGMLDDVSRLLSRLYACDSQRPFRTGEDFWLAGRVLLSTDSFLSDAIEAGPETLGTSSEVTPFGGCSPNSLGNSKQHSVAGARELLRVAPYLVPFSSRAKIFQKWIAKERYTSNFNNGHIATMGRSVAVRRKFIFEDAYNELNDLGEVLKATIRVKFIDEHGIEEAGIDGGGVFKEFMYEVLRIGFAPYLYGLFKDAPDGRLYPHPDAPVGNDNFRTQFAFLGRMLGKAVFDGVLVDIPLASFFLSKLLGHYNYPIDLGSLDPELYKNMKFLKSCPPSLVEDLGLNFTIANNAYGKANELELIKNGRNVAVSAANRIEYIHRVANYRMNIQIKEQCDAFLRGFSDVVPLQFIRLFSREELQLLISGKSGRIDLEDLQAHTKYSGGYDDNTPVIKWFWQTMSELKPEEQSKMLQFVTSSPRAPLLGFSYMVPGFCIHRAEGDIRLPTASTCMNLLKLPQYKSLDVVRKKVRYAIESNAGFDLS